MNLAGAIAPRLSGLMGSIHAGVPQSNLPFEHEFDGLAAMRVQRCPRAGFEIDHELHQLGLSASVCHDEPRLGHDLPLPIRLISFAVMHSQARANAKQG